MAQLVFLILVVAVIFAILIAVTMVMNNYLSEGEKWDMAATNMRMEGYTDLEIEEILGKRPE